MGVGGGGGGGGGGGVPGPGWNERIQPEGSILILLESCKIREESDS